jgi:hypothetical protein
MKRVSLAVLAWALTACSPPQSDASHEINVNDQTPAAAQAAGCFAEASQDWSAVGSQYYVIEAEATGPTCRDAVATLRITSRDGAVLFEHAYPTAQVPLAFNPNGDQTGLRNELEEWIQNTADTPTADWLPAWPAGASHPPRFRPASGVTRNAYEQFRGNQGPLFCYPDGGESNACIAMVQQRATLLGSLTPEQD